MKVIELLDNPTKWCRRGLARNKEGQGVSYKSGEANSYCLAGAVSLCYPEREIQNAMLMKLGNIAKKLFGSPALTTFNNDPKTTWDMVCAVLEEAKI